MLVFAAALAGLPCACGERAAEKPWEVSGEVPAGFPADAPVYPNGRVEVGLAARRGLVIWRTSDPVPVVQRYLTEQLRAKGWTVAAYPGVAAPWLGAAGGITLVATAADRHMSYAVGEQEGSTSIAAIWGGRRHPAS